MKLRAIVLALALAACGQTGEKQPRRPTAPAAPDPFDLNIEIGRYGAMLDQVDRATPSERPGSAEPEVTDAARPRPAPARDRLGIQSRALEALREGPLRRGRRAGRPTSRSGSPNRRTPRPRWKKSKPAPTPSAQEVHAPLERRLRRRPHSRDDGRRARDWRARWSKGRASASGPMRTLAVAWLNYSRSEIVIDGGIEFAAIDGASWAERGTNP